MARCIKNNQTNLPLVGVSFILLENNNNPTRVFIMYARNAGLFKVAGIDKFAPTIDKCIQAYHRGTLHKIASKIFFNWSPRDKAFLTSAFDVAIFNLQQRKDKSLQFMLQTIASKTNDFEHEFHTETEVVDKFTKLIDEDSNTDELIAWVSHYKAYLAIHNLLSDYVSTQQRFQNEIARLTLEADKENLFVIPISQNH